MVPETPLVCGVRSCFGGIKDRDSTCLELRCDQKHHHKGFLCKDPTGSFQWKWITRTIEEQLTSKGFQVCFTFPDKKPDAEKKAEADGLELPAELGSDGQAAPSTPPRNGAALHAQVLESDRLTPAKPLLVDQKIVNGRRNFGGKVCRKASCEVCGVPRDDSFHGCLGLCKNGHV